MSFADQIIKPGPNKAKYINEVAAKCARNSEIEKKLKETLQGKSESDPLRQKLGFLYEGHKHYNYFRDRIAEEKIAEERKQRNAEEEEAGQEAGEQPQAEPDAAHESGPPSGWEADGANQGDEGKGAAAYKFDPHPDEYTIELDMGLTSVPQLDLEIILEYVAREVKYGSEFTNRFQTTQLSQDQNLFDFLDPDSGKYGLYKNILAVYRRVQSSCATDEAVENMIEQLDNFKDASYVLRTCRESAEAIQSMNKAKEDQAKQTTATKFVNYDWHNFSLIEEFSAMYLGLDTSQTKDSDLVSDAHLALRDAPTIAGHGVIPQRAQPLMNFDPKTGELVSVDDATTHVQDTLRSAGGGGGGPQKRNREDNNGLASAEETAASYMNQL